MYDEDGEHLPLSSNSRCCEDLKNDTNLQMARNLSTIYLIQARIFRVTLLPSSTPWTADVIGPLLPKGCQVPLLAKFLWECLFHQAYICGPPAFFASTRDLLQEVYLDSHLYLDEVKTPLSLPRWGWSRRTSSLSALDHKPRKDNCPAGQAPKWTRISTYKPCAILLYRTSQRMCQSILSFFPFVFHWVH